MIKSRKYLIVFMVALVVPTLFLFVTKDIEYNNPIFDPPAVDELYVSGKGWPLPIYNVMESGGIAGQTIGPNTNFDILFVEFAVIFIASFSIGILVILISNFINQKK